MALIYCRECGKEMSDMAQTCPKCGAPNISYALNEYNMYNNSGNTITNKKNSILNIIGLIMMLIGFGINIIFFLLVLISGTKLSFSVLYLVIFIVPTVCAILSLIKIKPFVFTIVASVFGILGAICVFFSLLSISVSGGLVLFYILTQLVIIVGCVLALIGLKEVKMIYC